MSEANKIQIGGDHYKVGPGAMEHWDVMIAFGIHYLHAAASKYVSRHRSKAGRVDLEKAIHYLQKANECKIFVTLSGEEMSVVTEWALGAPGMNLRDYAAIHRMLTGDNSRAISIIEGILEKDYPRMPDNYSYEEQPEGEPKGRAFIRDPLPKLGGDNDVVLTDSVQAEERRVPRFDTETEVRHRVGDVEETKITRHNYRGGKDVPISDWPAGTGPQDRPWVVTESWMADLRVRRDVVPMEIWDRFYVKWATDVYKLEPFVESPLIPVELQQCYAILTNHEGPTSWLLDIRRVPAALRDYFPRLPREVNYVQLEQSPTWWKALYKMDETETKLVLINEAWHGSN